MGNKTFSLLKVHVVMGIYPIWVDATNKAYQISGLLLIPIVVNDIHRRFGLISLGQKGLSVMSGICAFFGHRDTPAGFTLENLLETTIRNLIDRGINEFWVGNEGNFDRLAQIVLYRLKQEYKSRIYLCYISAYNPDKFSATRRKWLEQHYELEYPFEVAKVPPKFAIEQRNKYIADNADIIICFIIHHRGGAYKAMQRAQKNGKTVINLADTFNLKQI